MRTQSHLADTDAVCRRDADEDLSCVDYHVQ
jgi:hypothetical protein